MKREFERNLKEFIEYMLCVNFNELEKLFETARIMGYNGRNLAEIYVEMGFNISEPVDLFNLFYHYVYVSSINNIKNVTGINIEDPKYEFDIVESFSDTTYTCNDIFIQELKEALLKVDATSLSANSVFVLEHVFPDIHDYM